MIVSNYDTNAGAAPLCRHVDSPAKRLERIAGEYNHMLYLIDKAGELPFVQSLNPVSDDDRIH